MADDTRRLSALLTPARVQVYGYAVAVLYAGFLIGLWRRGGWIADAAGTPIYTDFALFWVAGVETLRGQAAVLYNSATFVRMQAALLGTGDYAYPNWPYPPIFSLLLVPLVLLPYAAAFLTWNLGTLLAMTGVAWAIVRRRAAVAVVLASPFTIWNFLAGQNGFLTGALLGAALLSLERRPLLAGVFIGGLAYKPQYGLLFPVALAAARRWSAFASAAATVGVLIGASVLAFGWSAWQAYPQGLAAQFGNVLRAHAAAQWGLIQTVYGVVRTLGGTAALAWAAQAAVMAGLAVLVWCVWRSPRRPALRAATLAAAALAATPYAFAYDMAALAIPVAFLVRDQLDHGWLKGEPEVLLGLFGALLAALIVLGDRPDRLTFGEVPFGPFVLAALLALILRRLARRPAAA